MRVRELSNDSKSEAAENYIMNSSFVLKITIFRYENRFFDSIETNIPLNIKYSYELIILFSHILLIIYKQ